MALWATQGDENGHGRSSRAVSGLESPETTPESPLPRGEGVGGRPPFGRRFRSRGDDEILRATPRRSE
jgi:hypothetical protein